MQEKSSALTQPFVMMLALVHFCYLHMGKGDEDRQATKHGRKEWGGREDGKPEVTATATACCFSVATSQRYRRYHPFFSAFETTVEGLFWRPLMDRPSVKKSAAGPLVYFIDEVRVGEAEVNRWNLP